MAFGMLQLNPILLSIVGVVRDWAWSRVLIGNVVAGKGYVSVGSKMVW